MPVLGSESVPHRNPPGDGLTPSSPFGEFPDSAPICGGLAEKMEKNGRSAANTRILPKTVTLNLSASVRVSVDLTGLTTAARNFTSDKGLLIFRGHVYPPGWSSTLQRFLIPRNVEIDSLRPPTIASRAWGSLLDQFDHPRR